VRLLLALTACGVPNEERVARDFAELFLREVGAEAEPVILSIFSGEGDSGNVYKHVRFDVVALRDVNFRTGWLAGQSLVSGRRLSGGEAVLLYQVLGSGDWVLTWHELDRRPR
jgi:hypothetical protein